MLLIFKKWETVLCYWWIGLHHTFNGTVHWVKLKLLAKSISITASAINSYLETKVDLALQIWVKVFLVTLSIDVMPRWWKLILDLRNKTSADCSNHQWVTFGEHYKPLDKNIVRNLGCRGIKLFEEGGGGLTLTYYLNSKIKNETLILGIGGEKNPNCPLITLLSTNIPRPGEFTPIPFLYSC